MKDAMFCRLAACLFAILATEPTWGGGDAQIYLRRMDELTIKKDPVAILNLLGELDTVEFWSFGAGLGPTDSDSLQLTALQAFYDSLSDSEGRPRFDPSIGAGLSLATNTLRWVHLLQTDPNNQRELTRLLDDDKPAVRWLGLKKATFLAQFDDSVRDKLRALASGDPYVQISRRLQQTDKNRPPTPGMTVNEFVCPLRELACGLLNRHGYKVSMDIGIVAQRGVDRLIYIYDSDEKKRRAVLDAISLLDPKGAGVSMLKQSGSKTDTNSTANVLLHAIHESK